MKAVILTAGNAKRLMPITLNYGKVLVPIYNKPMIFYGISLMLKCGIRDITIVVNKKDKKAYCQLFKPYQKYIKINCCVQTKPLGTAHALKCARKHIGSDDFVLLFGDNVFVADSIANEIQKALKHITGVTIFTKQVQDPQRYGIVSLDKNNNISNIEEKPRNPQSNNAITGLYVMPNSVFKKLKLAKKSMRGEYELTDIISDYVAHSSAQAVKLCDTVKWLDTGTFASLLECSKMVKEYEQTHNLLGCIEADMYNAGIIDKLQLDGLIARYCQQYKDQILSCLQHKL